MEVPKREEFILGVRRAARLEQKPAVAADSRRLKTDAIAQVLQGAALWLTPKIVEDYDAGDFTSCPESFQKELQNAVANFRRVAKTVSPNRPASQVQFTKGLAVFRQLTTAIRDIVLWDWENATEKLLSQAETWGKEEGWELRREKKEMEETLLGEYDIQQLLFYSRRQLYVLDPVARFVPGAMGAFDLAIHPSYYTTSLYRYFDDGWYVHLEVGQGVGENKGVPWEKGSFLQCVEELRSLL